MLKKPSGQSPSLDAHFGKSGLNRQSLSGPSLVTLIGEGLEFSFDSSSLLSQPMPSLSPSNPFGSFDDTSKFLSDTSSQSRSCSSVSSTRRGAGAFVVLKVNPSGLCANVGSVVVEDANAGSVVVEDANAGSVVVEEVD